MSKQTLLERDIKATIRLLRFMTKGQGYADISLFDAGAGGGFDGGTVHVNLERDGYLFNSKNDMHSNTPKELFEMILSASNFSHDEQPIEELNKHYKRWKWNT